jgi:uncharacterized membrane-anchored protein YitT (DUF2179 family)
MTTNQSRLTDSGRSELVTKVVLTLFFLGMTGLFCLVSALTNRLQIIYTWSVFDFILLSLATFRLGRLVAYARVMEPFRLPFARTVRDSTGAGESVEARGEGVRQAIGQLITCPICAGTWIAAGLVFSLVWLPDFTRVFLWMTAGIAAAEIINSLVEALCWGGQLSRVRVGEMNRRQQAQDEKTEPG